MATIRLPRDFKDFLRSLNAHGVEYLLLGGYAVIYYGHVRSTADMDIWIAVSPENAQRVVASLRDFGFSSAITPDSFLETGFISRMGIPPFRIEILTNVSGLDFADAYLRRVKTSVDGVEVNVIGLQDLRRNKKASGRHKDLADLEELADKQPPEQ